MEKNEIICLSSDDESKCQASVMKKINKSPQKVNLKVNDETFKKRKQSDVPEPLPAAKRLKSTILSDCKPKLVIRKKISIPHDDSDTFQKFISLCLQRERSKDMEKIVNKLKRRYEQMNTEYKKSQEFINLLDENRDNMSKSGVKLYAYIREVMDAMKTKRGTSHCVKDEIPQLEEEKKDPELKRKNDKIRLLESTMRKCEKKIQKLEESEVDFDEDNDSNYIKVAKYKNRMVELYNKYCELTEENADAGRAYLRPKHVNSTGIVSVDQAITSFINAKISRRNKMKKNNQFVENLVFPDYHDILECIQACNKTNNLGLETKRQEQIAKKAFIKLGEYLQTMRRNDYWDTFSMFLENQEDDPALKDPVLEQKLRNNLTLGKIKLTEQFDKYARKQEFREQNSDWENSTDELENSNEDNDESLDKKNKNINEKEKVKNKVATVVNKNEKVVENSNIKTDNEESQSKRETVAVNNNFNASNEFADRNKNSPKASIAKVISQPEKPNEKLPSRMVTCISTANDGDIEVKLTEAVIDLDKDYDKETEGEKSSFLRVCSFAKPPTTWEDGRQKPENTNLSAQIVINNKSLGHVIDLTNDQIKKIAPNIPKTLPKICKLTPVPMKNIINVKHVTNNFVKLSESLSAKASGTTVKINSVHLSEREKNVKRPTYVYVKTGGNQTIATITKNKNPEIQTAVSTLKSPTKLVTPIVTKSPPKGIVLSKANFTTIQKLSFLQKNCTLVKRNGVPVILQKKVDNQNHVVSSTSDVTPSKS